jgi:phosphoglycolate phosphatase-like HAD superfamily hydrolase
MLLLFDIDGTLVRRAGPHHRQALEHAVLAVTGRPATTDGIPVQGMLDGDILRWMLQAAGARPSEIRTALPAILQHAPVHYETHCPDLRRKVCPGVRSFLQRAARRQIPMGLVTGNLTRIAWKKLDAAGLRHRFAFGAFADMGPTRAALARLAYREARRLGLASTRTPVALIGDHPNDIAAARANGFLAIAVGTGVVPLKELEGHQPDLLVPDLRILTLESIEQSCRPRG